MSSQMQTLVKKRASIKRQLTRFENKLKGYDSTQFDELQLRINSTKQILKEFNLIQEQIEQLDDIDLETQNAERESFETQYFSNFAKANKLIAEHTAADASSAAGSISGSSNIADALANTHLLQTNPLNVKLPQIKLIEFSGSYDKWPQFRDSFDALVNNNPSLQPVQKFYYLQSVLKGEAAGIIQALEASTDNYKTAWDLLSERFENKRVVTQTHLKGIFEIMHVRKESVVELRTLIDQFQKHYRSLKNMGENVEDWNTILLYIVGNKLDNTTRREWELSLKRDDVPTIHNLIDFIANKCQILESINNKSDNPVNKPKSSLSHVVTTNFKCAFCEKTNHKIFTCDAFTRLKPKDRYTEIKKRKLCINCLRPGHLYSNCKSGHCKKCTSKHNTMLHFENSSDQENTVNSVPESLENEPSTSTSCCAIESTSSFLIKPTNNVILPTAIVCVYDSKKNVIKARALLDTGSQSNFISESLFRKLNLTSQSINIPVKGISESLINITQQVNLKFGSNTNAYTKNINCLIIKQITGNIPESTLNLVELNIPQNIQLADTNFNSPMPIDLLLGANVFFDLLCIGQVKLGKNMPILQNSKLGWLIAGNLLSMLPLNETQCHFSISDHDAVQTQLERFWAIEECTQKQFFSPEEEECEKIFNDNVKQTDDGNFLVKLPVKNNINKLGNSFDNALKRFYQLERKLNQNEQVKLQYKEFIDEYLRLGHANKICIDDDTSKISYYLPHHCVFKESSTTKLRVVFDGSAKSDTNISLNDTLMVGPTLQDDIFSISVRFRFPNFVITGDIEKMYRQVYIDENQRSLQRIIWRDNKNEKICILQLNTLTYGTASAAFLAIRSLREAANRSKLEYPQASEVILRDFYVDDLLTGSNDIGELLKLKNEVTFILKQYGLNLRKFVSNDIRLLSDGVEPTNYCIAESGADKTLGLKWNARQDSLHYNQNIINVNNKSITKRIILSTISKLFDPLGLIGPCIIKAKIILQHLWQLKLGWDQSVPLDLQTLWLDFYSEIDLIHNFVINRQVTVFNYFKIQLHGFSDASETAYGGAIYVCSESNSYKVSHLLCAKSRVAPLKKVSLPRLELCAALLLAQLMRKVKTALNLSNHSAVLWCDSTIVLAWLNQSPHVWHTFVANRVAQIHELTKDDAWLHVPSEQNPADIISRGMRPQELENSELWWHGPHWIKMNSESWPKSKPNVQITTLEAKPATIVNCVLAKNEIFIDKFSNFNRLVRVTTYILRFINGTKGHKTSLIINANETQAATIYLIKLIQSREFAEERKQLAKNLNVSNQSKLLSLNPFLDKDGIIRVGGRLKHTDLTFDQKHPVILPKKSNLTKLIIKHEHHRNLHLGAQSLHSTLRQTYWIIGGRDLIRSILKQCVTCFRVSPKPSKILMGDLPSLRVTATRPFYATGVDFAGPFSLKDGVTRGRKIVKAYVCIFVCMASKAVHIELVGDLSSDSFLNCLKRFVSRRGICKVLYSDNATNFIGAHNELVSINAFLNSLISNDKFNNWLCINNIDWKFIPPRSPHFGGIWEAAVKSCKSHLRKILGNSILHFEALYTLLVQIEAILNSRPLFPLSNDPNDLTPLTPGHFLVGHPLNAIPQENVIDIQTNRLSNYKQLQQLLQNFWKTWKKNYLHTLQQRHKWQGISKEVPIQIGELVLLKEENTPPLQWPLGRIQLIHPGSDGQIRVVTVKTSNGLFKRAVVKIVRFPQED